MKNKKTILIVALVLIVVLVATYITINKLYENYREDNNYIECCTCEDNPYADVCCECNYNIFEKLNQIIN